MTEGMSAIDPPRTREELEAWQDRRWARLWWAVAATNPFWQRKLTAAGFDLNVVPERTRLSELPFTTKAELVADQAAAPPYGTNLTAPRSAYLRLHQTSGTTGAPLRWLDTTENWAWCLGCWRRIFDLAGLAADERIGFPFSFGPFLGFWAGFEGAQQSGRFCLAAGGLGTAARLQLFRDHEITCLCCTPTYALRLAETAGELGLDLRGGSVKKLIVAGEPGGQQPGIRDRLSELWGARVFDHWGMTEVGPLAVEAEDDPGHLTMLGTECLAEVVDSQTGAPVAPGTVGELVVTNLGRVDSPLIRYRTGDLVVAATDAGPRPDLRLVGGILGRLDDMLTIRGNNVYPVALESLLREFDEIVEYRIRVESRRAMQHIRIEIEPRPEAAGDGLLARISQRVKDRFQFQPDVELAAPGTLPRFELKGRRFVREGS